MLLLWKIIHCGTTLQQCLRLYTYKKREQRWIFRVEKFFIHRDSWEQRHFKTLKYLQQDIQFWNNLYHVAVIIFTIWCTLVTTSHLCLFHTVFIVSAMRTMVGGGNWSSWLGFFAICDDTIIQDIVLMNLQLEDCNTLKFHYFIKFHCSFCS